MRDLAQIIYENFFPQCLSACPVYSWKLLPVVMIISFSELSLLEFTAFIMACPASVHQLKRSQPYSNLAWPQIAELLYPPLLLPLVFSPWHTDMYLKGLPFLSFFLTLCLAVLVHWSYPGFMMLFTFLWKQCLFCPLRLLPSPHPSSCSLLPSFCSRWRLYHLNPSFT